MIREFLKTHPIEDGELVTEYFDRVQELLKQEGTSTSAGYIKKVYYRTKKLTLREEKRNESGALISTRHVNELPIPEVPDNLEVDGMTVYSATGATWTKYNKPKDNKTGDLDKVEALKYLATLPTPPKRVLRYNPSKPKNALVVVITDTHVGMAPNPKSYAMFKRTWTTEDIMGYVDNIIQEVRNEYDGEQDIFFLDLGDFMDGYEGQTTRRGHHLPQNLDSREALKIGAEFKLQLLDGIQQATGANVISHHLCNDNHAGTYGWVVNQYAKVLCENANKRIAFNVHEQFIVHFTYADKIILLCHGKDESEQKFSPFTIPIGKKGEKLIRDYMKEHNIRDHVYFFKGDSHVMHLDMYSMSGIDYVSFLPLCPPSYWTQPNFGSGRQGYSIFKLEEGKKNISIKIVESE
jgi:UDP-2,3-diacylglucosamine pyrophosphatase LpxH